MITDGVQHVLGDPATAPDADSETVHCMKRLQWSQNKGLLSLSPVNPFLQVLQAVLTQKGALIGARNVAKGVAELLPSLVERVGESNVRLKEAATEAVRQLAALPESGLANMTAVIVKCVALHSSTTTQNTFRINQHCAMVD